MLHSSIQSFILADKTKFGNTYLARVNAECDFIITDERKRDYNYDWVAERCTLMCSMMEQ